MCVNEEIKCVKREYKYRGLYSSSSSSSSSCVVWLKKEREYKQAASGSRHQITTLRRSSSKKTADFLIGDHILNREEAVNQRRTMASVKELLKNSLKDLGDAELKEFQWHLEKDLECISKSEMENADRIDTVDKMVARFGSEGAVKITVNILRKMNQNNLAEQLENKHKQAQAEGSIEDPALAGVSSKPTEDSIWLTLDLNTVSERLRLSEGNTVTFTDREESYPDHPDRFDHDNPQVLCRESVSDRRCYWEIEWRGRDVSISVSYKSIRRKREDEEGEEDDECVFGSNDQSWSLDCSPNRYSFRHNGIWTDLPVKPIISRVGLYVEEEEDDDYDGYKCLGRRARVYEEEEDYYRIGVYVDHSAGTLSFYSVSGDKKMSLIHTVQTTFTQPLYPGFRVGDESSLELLYCTSEYYISETVDESE